MRTTCKQAALDDIGFNVELYIYNQVVVDQFLHSLLTYDYGYEGMYIELEYCLQIKND